MTVRNICVVLISLLSLGLAPTSVFRQKDVGAETKLSQQELCAHFKAGNEAFRQANSLTDEPNQAKKLYEKAILSYEKIINEGEIRNAKLYYNLANAYFLNEQPGKAILNYRRAENQPVRKYLWKKPPAHKLE